MLGSIAKNVNIEIGSIQYNIYVW